MFSLRAPSRQKLEAFRHAAARDELSYPEHGATLRGGIPKNYNVDANRVQLGTGIEVWERAKTALESWRMFDIGWVRLLHCEEPIAPGQTVLIVAHTFGVYSVSASRILERVSEAQPGTKGIIQRWGFCYGTLKHHVESGEERFLIEHHLRDHSIWYSLLAFSRPQHWFAKLGYPAARAMQRRFARDSMRAMVRAVR